MNIYRRTYNYKKCIKAIVLQLLPTPIVVCLKYHTIKREHKITFWYRYDLSPINEKYNINGNVKKINILELLVFNELFVLNVFEEFLQYFNQKIRECRTSTIMKNEKQCKHIYYLKKARKVLQEHMKQLR